MAHFEIRQMQNSAQLQQLLSSPKDIVITTHRNPDGDALGSSTALQLLLERLGHSVKVISPSEYPAFFAWMPKVADMLIYDLEPEDVEKQLQRADIIFCLDFNALERIDKVGEIIATLPDTTKVMIDHHLYPEDFPDFILSETSASSTCELIYDFVELMDWKRHLDPLIVECIYTGILTDTGGFKYATNAKLMRTVGQLLDYGIDNTEMQERIFNNMTEKQLRILGFCLSSRMEILPEFKTGIIWLSKKDYEKLDIQRGDTEGVVNYLLRMPNVRMAAFVHEQPTITKLSLRSKGSFSVQELAREHFRGGGHQNASGGASYIGLMPTLRKLKGLLPQYQEGLLKDD